MDEIIKALAEMYRRRGYSAPGVPVVAFLEQFEQQTLEAHLAELLNSGAVVAYRRGSIALSPNLRLAILNENVLRRWSLQAEGQPKGAVRHLIETIRDELRSLTGHAGQNSGLPDEIVSRAAELAGVLAVADLQPEAMDVVAAHGGAPVWRLSQLLTLPEESCATLEDLRKTLRRLVSTEYAGPRPGNG